MALGKLAWPYPRHSTVSVLQLQHNSCCKCLGFCVPRQTPPARGQLFLEGWLPFDLFVSFLFSFSLAHL